LMIASTFFMRCQLPKIHFRGVFRSHERRPTLC